MSVRSDSHSIAASVLALSVYALPFIATPTPALAQGCFTVAGQSESVSISLGGGQSAEMQIVYYAERAKVDDEVACEAWIAVPLSAFPTWRLAIRPSEVAPALRDVISRWGARECLVAVLLENDTGEDLSSGDECTAGMFRFEGRDWWASSSERPCEEDR